MVSLLPVAEAQARLFALGKPLDIEQAPLTGCIGRWLAGDMIARRDQPWTDLSAMDGYALASEGRPDCWRIVAESSAGMGIGHRLDAGEAVRIFTGAPLPPGADAILIQENARVEGDRLFLTDGALHRGQHVRSRGSDFMVGRVLIEAGKQLSAAHIGLAALAGHGALPVHRKPRIALLSTGNELVKAGDAVPDGKLPSSNAPMLAAMLASLPCEIEDHGIVPDRLDAMESAFRNAAHADIIVSTGGASVGDHDLVRPGFEGAGGTLDFWKVRMRPGKPLIAGKLNDTIFLGLPGNPVAAYVTGLLFLLPLIRHLGGSRAPLPLTSLCPLGAPLPPASERDDYVRAYRNADGAVLIGPQDSAATLALASADCLIVRPAHSPAANIGDIVKVIALD